MVDYLPNCVVIIVFVGFGRERFLPLARFTHRSLLQAPAYLAQTSTVFLSLLDNSRVPSHYQASKFYRTIPLLRFRANVRLLSSYTSRNFHPPADPSTGCQLFPSLATTSLRDILFESSVIMRIRLVRVGLLSAFSLRYSFRYCSSGRERRAPKIRNECKATSSRFKPNYATNSLITRRRQPYLTTQTDLPL